ncbi:hypothetical protein [Nonomuraea salmonea]|uniref:DUF3830 family protein n=1 Tax=Nonomuraea salmonea TaxID=46181 RepID=A0ABV5P2L0_9ACTN
MLNVTATAITDGTLKLDCRTIVYGGAPYLYLSPAEPLADALLLHAVKNTGLRPMVIDDEGVATLDEPHDSRWEVVIGPGPSYTINWPSPSPLYTYSGQVAPGWYDTAIDAGQALLFVGPPHSWDEVPSSTTMRRVIVNCIKGRGAGGVLTVRHNTDPS